MAGVHSFVRPAPREHSSVPTAKSRSRRAQGLSRLAALRGHPKGLSLTGPSTAAPSIGSGAGGACHIIGKFKPVDLGEIHAAGDTSASAHEGSLESRHQSWTTAAQRRYFCTCGYSRPAMFPFLARTHGKPSAGRPWESTQGTNVLATRKPPVSMVSVLQSRAAARRILGSFPQEPPRRTRPRAQSPDVHAEPSAGAPV
jgi:hypothetical protein